MPPKKFNQNSSASGHPAWTLAVPTAIELRILSVIPTRNPNPTLTLKETHTAEITIRIKSMKTAL